MDRYEHYIRVLSDRDQALLVLGGLVVSVLLWWGIGERWPRARAWAAWAVAVAYFIVMLFFVMIGGNPNVY